MAHRLAVILRTDIVGSTETSTALGADYVAFRNEHKRHVRTIIEDYDVQPQLTGDGFVAVIDTPTAAIECAGRIQQDLALQNERAGADDLRAIKVRITIDVGELSADAHDDPTTLAFAVTARLEEHAGAGDIVCTDIVRSLARQYVLPSRFTNRRTVEGKGLDEPVVIWDVSWQASLPDPVNLTVPTPPVDESQPFVGRNYELSELFGWLESACRNRRHLVMIQGPPGIGKSTLVRKFAAQAVDQQAALVLFGNCESPTTTPFGPFTEALRTFAGHSTAYPELLGANPQQLAQMLPDDLAESHGLATNEHRGNQEDLRFQLFEAFSSWLSVNARHRPVVLVIEDLHHTDRATLALLDHIVRSELPGRFLFITTHRTTESDWTAAFTNDVGALKRRSDADIVVPGLGQRYIIDLIGDFPHRASGSMNIEVAEGLWRYTGGNPLYLASLLAGNVDVATLAEDRSMEHVDLDVPSEVHTLTGARLNALSEDALHVVTIAALIGTRFNPDLIQSVVELDDASVAGALAEASNAGLIEPSTNRAFAFTHEILRDAVCKHAATTTDVSAAHVALGRALLTGEPSLDELASASIHLAYGNDEDALLEAIVVARDVARHGRARLSPQISAEGIERELALYDRLSLANRPSDADLMRRRYAFGQALRHAGDPRFIDVLRRVCTEAKDLGDPLLMASAALGSLRNNWDETGKVVTDTVEILRAAIDTVSYHAEREHGPARAALLGAQARLSGALAVELSFDPDRALRERYASDAITTARQLVIEQSDLSGQLLATDVLARTLERQHGVFTHPSGLLDREHIVDELAELQVTLHDPIRQFACASHSYWTRMELGDTTSAEASLVTLRELAHASAHPRQRAIWLHWQSLHAAYRGRLEQAVRLADQARALKTSMGDGDGDVLWIGLMFIPSLHRGTLPRLLDTMRECVGRTAGLVAIRSGIALALARSTAPGSNEEARVAVQELSIEDEFGHIAHNDLLISYALLTLTCQTLRDLGRAAQVRDRLHGYQFLADGRPRFIFNGTSMFGSLSHYLAVAQTIVGDWDAADETFRLALDHNHSIGAPALVAETECAWAEMLTTRGHAAHSDRARELARRSFSAATDLGLRAVQERADLLL